MGEERALAVVPGWQPAAERRRSPRSRSLTAEEVAQLRQALDVNEGEVDALDVLDAVTRAVTPRDAYAAGLRRADRLGDDAEHLRRVIASLAVQGVWFMPASENPGLARTAEEIYRRQTQMRMWTWDQRKKAMARIRRVRDLLRGTR